jgi:hypothetical protein
MQVDFDPAADHRGSGSLLECRSAMPVCLLLRDAGYAPRVEVAGCQSAATRRRLCGVWATTRGTGAEIMVRYGADKMLGQSTRSGTAGDLRCPRRTSAGQLRGSPRRTTSSRSTVITSGCGAAAHRWGPSLRRTVRGKGPEHGHDGRSRSGGGPKSVGTGVAGVARAGGPASVP